MGLEAAWNCSGQQRSRKRDTLPEQKCLPGAPWAGGEQCQTVHKTMESSDDASSDTAEVCGSFVLQMWLPAADAAASSSHGGHKCATTQSRKGSIPGDADTPILRGFTGGI